MFRRLSMGQRDPQRPFAETPVETDGSEGPEDPL